MEGKRKKDTKYFVDGQGMPRKDEQRRNRKEEDNELLFSIMRR